MWGVSQLANAHALNEANNMATPHLAQGLSTITPAGCIHIWDTQHNHDNTTMEDRLCWCYWMIPLNYIKNIVTDSSKSEFTLKTTDLPTINDLWLFSSVFHVVQRWWLHCHKLWSLPLIPGVTRQPLEGLLSCPAFAVRQGVSTNSVTCSGVVMLSLALWIAAEQIVWHLFTDICSGDLLRLLNYGFLTFIQKD